MDSTLIGRWSCLDQHHLRSGRNLDIAAVNVNNQVRQSRNGNCRKVRRQGVTVSKSSFFLVVAAVYSEITTLIVCSPTTSQNVLDAIKRIPGTTNVQSVWCEDYAMRFGCVLIAWRNWVLPSTISRRRIGTKCGTQQVKMVHHQTTRKNDPLTVTARGLARTT